MGIRQKVEDASLLVKKDRKWKFFIGLGVVFLIFSLVWEAPTRRRGGTQETAQVGTGQLGAGESYQDLITSFEATIQQVKKSTDANQARTEELGQRIKDNEERTAAILKKILHRIETDSQQGNQQNFPDPVDAALRDANGEAVSPDTLEVFGADEPVVAPPPMPQAKKVAYVGAGDSVRVKLLAGVNAPTDGTPYPVVFKLVDDISGPDESRLPLGEARVVAAAQGSLADSRALFRLHTLNIRLPNGKRQVIEIDGWVVGEDGIRGMSGIPIDPIGKAIAAAGVGGFVEGIGQALSQSQVSFNYGLNGNAFQTVDGDMAAYALGQGISDAADEWNNIIQDRVRQLVPAIQVYSGREGTAVFSKSFEIADIYDHLEGGEFVFTSLD